MEWISVKERTPDTIGNYLCWDESYSNSTGSPAIGTWDLKKFHTNIAEDWTNVTHWMPLPSPPKED